MAEIIDGSDITKTRTLKTMYDMGCVEVLVDDDEPYRVHKDVLHACLNEFIFDVEKKIKHSYLTINWDKTQELWKGEGFV